MVHGPLHNDPHELPFAEEIEDRDPEATVRALLGIEDEDSDLPIADEVDGSELFMLAPAESHVQAFRHQVGKDGATIDVRYKPNGNSGVRQYRYKFGPGMIDYAQVVWEEMSAVDHPGISIWHWLIRPGIPYEETAVD